jgi:hypothetical protein
MSDSDERRYTDIELARWIAAKLEDGAGQLDRIASFEDTVTRGDRESRPPSDGVTSSESSTVPQDKGGRPDKGPWRSWIDRWVLRGCKEGLCESKKEACRRLQDIAEADGYKVSKTAAQNHLRGVIPITFEACSGSGNSTQTTIVFSDKAHVARCRIAMIGEEQRTGAALISLADVELARWIAGKLEEGGSQAQWLADKLEEGGSQLDRSEDNVKGLLGSWIDRWVLRGCKEGLCESKEEACRRLQEIAEADGYKVSETAAQNHLRGAIPITFEACSGSGNSTQTTIAFSDKAHPM